MIAYRLFQIKGSEQRGMRKSEGYFAIYEGQCAAYTQR